LYRRHTKHAILLCIEQVLEDNNYDHIALRFQICLGRVRRVISGLRNTTVVCRVTPRFYFCFHLDPDINLVLLILPLHRGHYTFCIHTRILQRNQCSQHRFMRANLLVNTANKHCFGRTRTLVNYSDGRLMRCTSYMIISSLHVHGHTYFYPLVAGLGNPLSELLGVGEGR